MTMSRNSYGNWNTMERHVKVLEFLPRKKENYEFLLISYDRRTFRLGQNHVSQAHKFIETRSTTSSNRPGKPILSC